MRERLGVEEAFGLGRLGQVHGDEVGLRVDVLGRVGLVDPQLAVALGADERVEGEHAHAEAPRALGDELADAPEAEDAERLLVQLDAGVFRAIPFAFVQRLVRLGDVAGEREQQRQRVLGGGDDVRLRARWRRRSRARVAAGTSTLSTPTPARPITRRLTARSISSAVIFVAERIRMPS